MTAKEALNKLTEYIKLDEYDYETSGVGDAERLLVNALTELEELKAKQVKVETIEGYGIDDVLAIIQGLKAKEITPEILHNHLKMYKCGYENGIKVANFYIEQAFKNI